MGTDPYKFLRTGPWKYFYKYLDVLGIMGFGFYIYFLEKHYQQLIKEIDTNLSLEVAPKHICNQTNIPEGSSWFTAVAVVLDRLKPVKTGKPRSLIVDQLRRKQRS